jgi:outer membrane receptor protein involved in Fe transport
VRNGDDAGFNARGSVNLPFSDTFALRASVFRRRDAGYIDNVQTGEEGINQADAHGGRLAALWRPSDRFSLKLSALAQKISGDGATSVDPPLGDLKQSRLLDTGWYDRTIQAYSAAATFHAGRAEITSISGYNVNTYSDAFDFSYALGATASQLFGVSGVAYPSRSQTKKFTQEFRATLPLGTHFEWLVGAYYMDEDSTYRENRFAEDPATGTILGRISFNTFPTTFREYAGFTDLTWQVTDAFDVQFGARQSHIEQTFSQHSINAANVDSFVPQLDTTDSAFTYLITPRLKLSPTLMAYVRLASGYRAGAPNVNAGGVVPVKYAPDKTQNYEIGVKGEFFDRALALDASLYHIDWRDIQIQLLSPQLTAYFVNTSRAKSQGAELSLDFRAAGGLRLSGWLVYNDAELTQAIPAGATAFGLDGDRLPISARWSGRFATDYDFPLAGMLTGSVGASLNYVGERIGPFTATSLRERWPSYSQVDLHAGIRREAWTASLFATNIGDHRGILYGGIGALPPTAYVYIQPRTIGMQVEYAFQ